MTANAARRGAARRSPAASRRENYLISDAADSASDPLPRSDRDPRLRVNPRLTALDDSTSWHPPSGDAEETIEQRACGR